MQYVRFGVFSLTNYLLFSIEKYIYFDLIDKIHEKFVTIDYYKSSLNYTFKGFVRVRE